MKDNELQKAILQLKSEMNTRFTLIEKSISEMRKESKNNPKPEKENRSTSTASIYDKITSKINNGGGKLNGRE